MKKYNYYTVYEIDKNNYRISSQEGVSMNLFVGQKKALLWDTGYGFGNLRAVIKNITEKPLIVVNSHGHLDHCNGNFQFLDYPIYMNERDWAAYNYFNGSAQRRFIAQRSTNMIVTWIPPTYGNILPDEFEIDVYSSQKQAELINLKEGMIFDLGNLSLEVYEIPGHTWGSTALLRKDTKELFIGDQCGPNYILSLFGATPAALEKSIQKITHLDFTRALGSHIDTWVDASVFSEYVYQFNKIDMNKGILFDNPMRFTDASINEYIYFQTDMGLDEITTSGQVSFIQAY